MVRKVRTHTGSFNPRAGLSHSPAPTFPAADGGKISERERSAPEGTDRTQVAAFAVMSQPTFLAADLVASASAVTALRMLVAAAFT